MVRIPENWSDWVIVNEDDPGEGAYSVVYEAARKDDPAIRCAIKVITVPQDRGEIKSLEVFENDEFYNDVETVRSEISWRPVNLIVFTLSN
ncbi:MAG: hypothetical protein IKE25_02755, partial [Clostridia bacterium]|nr:hypothetical protein [Clostridia bacterium]